MATIISDVQFKHLSLSTSAQIITQSIWYVDMILNSETCSTILITGIWLSKYNYIIKYQLIEFSEI